VHSLIRGGGGNVIGDTWCVGVSQSFSYQREVKVKMTMGRRERWSRELGL
jgi:hypothetical protein